MDNNVDNNINEENDNTENNQNEEVLDQEVKEENTNVENNQNVQTMNQEVKEEIVNDLTKKKSDPFKVAIIISTIIVVITIGFIGFFWIMWPEIQKGEIENIYPYQTNVDAAINSSLVYEIG